MKTAFINDSGQSILKIENKNTNAVCYCSADSDGANMEMSNEKSTEGYTQLEDCTDSSFQMSFANAADNEGSTPEQIAYSAIVMELISN